MKKNLWVLLALSALIAMFVIAGCAPKPSPSPTPTPTATVAPTTPVDTAAPKVVSTDVYKYYGYDYCSECDYAICDSVTVGEQVYDYCCYDQGSFKIVITFDENIDTLLSSCMLNPYNWAVSITNSGRYAKGDISAEILKVEIDGKKVVLTGSAIEVGVNKVYPDPTNPTQGVEIPYSFCGLICNSTDANYYAASVNGDFNGFPVVGVIAAPKVADEVCWELSSSCVVADELGNVNCGYSGCDCCLEPTCESCEEGCPFGEPVCPTCVNPCE